MAQTKDAVVAASSQEQSADDVLALCYVAGSSTPSVLAVWLQNRANSLRETGFSPREMERSEEGVVVEPGIWHMSGCRRVLTRRGLFRPLGEPIQRSTSPSLPEREDG